MSELMNVPAKGLSNDRITAILYEMLGGQTETNNRLSTVEQKIDYLQNRIYVNSAQKKHIQIHVKDKVKQQLKGMDYKTNSRVLFQAIYSDVNDQYNVTTYHELPAQFYEDIISKIDSWIMTETIRQRLST